MKFEERASWRRKSVTHSASLRSGYRKHVLSIDEPLCRDLLLPQFPLSKIGTHPPTCLTDKAENGNWTGRLKKTSSLDTWQLTIRDTKWTKSEWSPQSSRLWAKSRRTALRTKAQSEHSSRRSADICEGKRPSRVQGKPTRRQDQGHRRHKA